MKTQELSRIVDVVIKNIQKRSDARLPHDDSFYWTKSILKELKKLKSNDVEAYSNRIKLQPVNSIKYVKSGTVSIDNFVVVTAKNHHAKILAEYFSNEDNWSIPYHLKLIKAFISGELHEFLEDEGLLDYEQDITDFINNSCGMLSKNTKLTAIKGLDGLTWEEAMLEFTGKMIKTIGCQEALVGVFGSRLVYDTRKGNVNVESSRELEVGKAGNKDSLVELIWICRRLDISITK